jgi:hypothetical protein
MQYLFIMFQNAKCKIKKKNQDEIKKTYINDIITVYSCNIHIALF